MKKKIILILSVLLGAGIIALLTVNFLISSQNPTITSALPSPRGEKEVLTREEVIQDCEQLISLMEESHPFFYKNDLPDDYTAARDIYRSACSKEMTVQEFGLVSSVFLCFFQDRQTKLNINFNTFFDAELTYKYGKMYLEPFPQPIISICGVNIKDAYRMIDMLFPAENEMASRCNYEKYCLCVELLSLCDGFYLKGTGEIAVESDKIYSCKLAKPKLVNLPMYNYTYSEAGIFVVDFNSCQVDEKLEKICKELKSERKKGEKKFIIDARGNKGGNSTACRKLLKALGMKEPQYSMVVRYSPLAKKQNKYRQNNGYYFVKGKTSSRKNPDVDLIVLTDRYTYSSATMLAVYVRDGKLGRIVGEPPGNKPSPFGDIIWFTLDNSRLSGTFSHKKFIRPDSSRADEVLLQPDIEIDREEAFVEAVKLLNR